MNDTGKATLLGVLATLGVVLVGLTRHERELKAIKRANGEYYGIDWEWASITEQGRGNWLRGFFLVPPQPKNLHTGQIDWVPMYPLTRGKGNFKNA